ncbi:hypothetical protein [Streptomyces sp. NPDC006193]|uniref:hypothetical protein n=1 Tax=Streptomyces sp. NPDC006193 TaxID=3155717 RepID=UPI0033B4C195
MSRGQRTSARLLVPFLVTAAAASAAWAAWLGGDDQYDVRPDGSATGPYEAWQVAGLVLTLLVPVCWAAARRHPAGAVLGTTAGLTAAAFADWSDDSSGLFAVGVGMVALGSLAASAAVAAVVRAVTAAVRRHGRGTTA